MIKESGAFLPPIRSYHLRVFGIGFILLFLIAGAFGHDPWKQDETYSFGVIYHFYASHDWLIAMNAGAPFMEKPPLYYWTAAFFCKLLSGFMPLPDAARSVNIFYMMLTCFCLWATSQILFVAKPERRAMGYTSLVLFLGSFGVARHAHDMFTDVALLAGVSVAYLGMSMFIMKQKTMGCLPA